MSPKSTGAVFEAHYEDSEEELQITLVLDYPTRLFFLTVGDTPTVVIDPLNASMLGNFLSAQLGCSGGIDVTEEVREIAGPDPNRRFAEGETVADRALENSALYADWLEREGAAQEEPGASSDDTQLFQGTAAVMIGADGQPMGLFNPDGSPKRPELTYWQGNDRKTVQELSFFSAELQSQMARCGVMASETLKTTWVLLPSEGRPTQTEFINFQAWRMIQRRGNWTKLWRRPDYGDYFRFVINTLAEAINDLDPALSRAPQEANA